MRRGTVFQRTQGTFELHAIITAQHVLMQYLGIIGSSSSASENTAMAVSSRRGHVREAGEMIIAEFSPSAAAAANAAESVEFADPAPRIGN